MSKLMRMLSSRPSLDNPYSGSLSGLALCLAAALLLAAIMMVVYRMCHNSLTYNKQFNVTLMMLAMASTVLLALIQNNPMLSLGALGALSICRIRTNTRDPRDLGFVFWSLAIGISCALGEFVIGLVCTLVMSCVMLLFHYSDRPKDTLTVVVRGQREQVGPAQAVFQEVPGAAIQAKNLYPNSFELVYTLSDPQCEQDLVLTFNNMEGIDGVNVLAPQTQVA